MVTQDDIDNCADIAWWIKGYKAGNDLESPFGQSHINSMGALMTLARESLKGDLASKSEDDSEIGI